MDTISLSEAVELIRRQLKVATPGDIRARGYLADTERIARACGCLPLALWIAAAILRGNVHLSLAYLADELESSDILERLAVGANDSASSPDQVFAASYARLNELDALTFRILGAMPGLTVSTAAVAVTAGMTEECQAHDSLSRLQQAHLVSRESVSERWQVHDLVRQFAVRLIESPGRESEISTALTRVLGYYAFTIAEADEWISPEPKPGPENIFFSEAAAFAFLDAEKGTAIACVRVAIRRGLAPYACRIAIELDHYLNICRDHASAVELLSLARDAAATLTSPNSAVLAIIHNQLGWALREMRQYAAASQNHRLSAEYAEVINSPLLQCQALEYLGVSLWHEKKFKDALEVFDQTIALCDDNNVNDDNRSLLRVKAMATNDRGLCYRSLNRFDDSLIMHREALKMYSEIGARDGIGTARYNIGYALVAAGRPSEAIPVLKESIANREELGRTANHEKALTLMCLGRAYGDDGQRTNALRALTQALEIFETNNDLSHQAEVYQILGHTERRSSKALSACESALELYKQLGEANEQAEVERKIAALTKKRWQRIRLRSTHGR